MNWFKNIVAKVAGRKLTPKELQEAQIKEIAKQLDMSEEHVKKRWQEFQIKKLKHAIKKTKTKTKLMKKLKSQTNTGFNKFYKGK